MVAAVGWGGGEGMGMEGLQCNCRHSEDWAASSLIIASI